LGYIVLLGTRVVLVIGGLLVVVMIVEAIGNFNKAGENARKRAHAGT
jgi:hypothetical protein